MLCFDDVFCLSIDELISMLENLGTMSITAAELKHMVSLLKPEADSKVVSITGAHVHKIAREKTTQDSLFCYLKAKLHAK